MSYEEETTDLIVAEWKARAEKAEARVAELRELLIGAHVGGPEWERKVADAIYGQAREREEC